LEGKGGGVTLGKQKTKDMSKTIKEWLEELPEGYRERALANTYKSLLEAHDVSMVKALTRGFVWGKSQERFDFWADVESHYATGTPLPPLPQKTKPLKSNEQIFDEVAASVMAEYSPSGFRKKFKTLHKAIIIAMEKAVEQHKNA
jgi:hypothetical protein